MMLRRAFNMCSTSRILKHTTLDPFSSIKTKPISPIQQHSTVSIDTNAKKQETLLPTSLTSSKDVSGIPAAMAASFWDLTSPLQQDYIVIGAGIIGLSTAIHLKERDPTAKVLVLERGVLPQGASTRNAGFTCFGSLTEILEDIRVVGEEKAITQVKDRWEGLQLLRKGLGDDAIGFKQTGNYELVSEDLLPELKHISKVNELLRPIFGEDVFSRVDKDIEKFGFSKKYVPALILNKFEGQLDSGKMMSALQQKASSLGVVIRYGSQAERPRNILHGVEVPVKNQDGTLLFRAKAAAVCVNAYMKDLLPEYNIQPGRGQILVTERLKEPLKFFAPCHMGKGYWYFRTLDDNRILLGGGRNLFPSQETTTELETTENIMGPLNAILQNVILPGQKPRIDYAWSGLMGFSENHLPVIEAVPGQPVVCGFNCNGMGVALGYLSGQRTASLLIKQAPLLDPMNQDELRNQLIACK